MADGFLPGQDDMGSGIPCAVCQSDGNRGFPFGIQYSLYFADASVQSGA